MIKTLPSNAESEGSIPGQETKGLQAAGCGKKKKNFFKKNGGCVMGGGEEHPLFDLQKYSLCRIV